MMILETLYRSDVLEGLSGLGEAQCVDVSRAAWQGFCLELA